MGRYRVILACDVRYTRTVEIEADDEEAAIEEAEAEYGSDGDFDDWDRHDWTDNETDVEEIEDE